MSESKVLNRTNVSERIPKKKRRPKAPQWLKGRRAFRAADYSAAVSRAPWWNWASSVESLSAVVEDRPALIVMDTASK